VERVVDLLIVGSGKHAQRQPKCVGGIAHLRGITRAPRIQQRDDGGGSGRKLAQQLKALRPQRGGEEAHAGDVGFRPRKIADETRGDRVVAGGENNRNPAGRGLGGPQRKVAAGGDQDGDLMPHQLRRHRRELFVVAFGPLERNRDVLAIDPASLGKSLAESRNHGGARLGRAAMQIADERELRLLRSHWQWPHNSRAADQ